jgi:hypothetical protein
MGTDRKQSYAEDRAAEKKQVKDANTPESTVLPVKHRQRCDQTDQYEDETG